MGDRESGIDVTELLIQTLHKEEFGWIERHNEGREREMRFEEAYESWKLLHHSWKSIRAKEMRHFFETNPRETDRRMESEEQDGL